MKFRNLVIGQTFDFINDGRPSYNSFYDRCIKTGPRKYRSTTTHIDYTVGSIDALVFHVE